MKTVHIYGHTIEYDPSKNYGTMVKGKYGLLRMDDMLHYMNKHETHEEFLAYISHETTQLELTVSEWIDLDHGAQAGLLVPSESRADRIDALRNTINLWKSIARSIRD